MSESSQDFPQLIKDCETAIRQGQFAEVQNKLLKLQARQIPRHHLAELSTLARRAHLSKLGLKWLHPIVRPAVASGRKASSREITEYALALQKAGALREALGLLASLDASEDPQVLLSLAYVFMARWDYAKADSVLKEYLQSPKITEYESLIGRVNRAAALVFLRASEAAGFLKSLETDLKDTNFKLLYSNCLEISAQEAVARNEWQEARLALQKARALVDAEKSLDGLFIEKWQSIVEALQKKDSAPLDGFRAKALEWGHWETLRDLDYYQARIEPSGVWASWVYYGTPYISFRQRLEALRDFPDEEWIARGSAPSVRLDPWFPPEGEGDLSHRCLVLLLRDFFRPLRVAEAFSALFPDEYYNPDSSPNRVHQAMTRMRKWMKDLQMPLHLLELEGAYSMRIPAETQLLCRKKLLGFGEMEFLFHRYPGLENGEFSTADLTQVMKRPQSTIQRFVKKAQEEGVLEKVGSARFTAYRLLPLQNQS